MNGGNAESYSMQKEAKHALRAYDELTKSDYYKSDSRYMVPEDRCKSGSKNPYQCDPSETWRSFDGSCNNLYQQWWGAANQPFQRMAKPAYDDGVK